MKKLAALVFGFLLIGIASNATTNNTDHSGFNNYNRYDSRAYIFEEGGIEFSVFADGQFDFSYLGSQNNGQVQVIVSSPNVNISYNAGHDYDLYVQYDDYGAVTQIENVPIYYDNYGRIVQAGSVDIRYNNRRIVRVGGLFINYNYYGHYVSSTGFINVYNQYYVYRPWHAYYVAPLYTNCIVYDYPYRRYYSPIRYSYVQHSNYYNNRHRVAYQNGRRSFNRPGSRLHYENGRTARNRNYNPNRRNTMVSESGYRANAANERPVSTVEEINRTRPNSEIKGRPSSNSGLENSNRPVTNITERPSSSDAVMDRNMPRSNTKERPATTRPTTSKRTASTRIKSDNSNVKRSSSSASNTRNNRGETSSSRGTSSKRGRGL